MKKTYFYLVLTALIFAPFIMNGQNNLLTNGDFEAWTSGAPDSWNTAQSVSQESTIVHSGTYSLGHTSQSSFKKLLQKVNVTAGTDYTISFWYYDNTNSAKIKLKSAFLAGSTVISPVGPGLEANLNPNDANWHHYSAVVTAPATATKIKVEIRVSNESGAVGGTVYYDDFYFGDVVSDPEPDNHVTNLASHAHALMYTLSWDDATGTVEPAGYLILGAKNGASITAPTDGTPVADDLDWSDDLVAVNVPFGREQEDFTELDSSMTYDFTIFPYTNAGNYIDYKVDGTVPTVNFTTDPYALINFEGFESGTSGSWTAVSVSGASVWEFPTFNGRTTAKMKSTNEVNEDWLISPALDLTGLDTVRFSFVNAKNGTGDSLRLFVSTDYSGDVATATWTNLSAKANWSAGSYATVHTDSLELTDYVGQTIYLAFKFTSGATDDMLYKIDNFQTYAVYSKTTTPDAIYNTTKHQLSVYPNPANTNVFINTEAQGTVSIIDALGREVVKENIVAGVNNIELSNLEKGVYFLHIIFDDGSMATSKLVVK